MLLFVFVPHISQKIRQFRKTRCFSWKNSFFLSLSLSFFPCLPYLSLSLFNVFPPYIIYILLSVCLCHALFWFTKASVSECHSFIFTRVCACIHLQLAHVFAAWCGNRQCNTCVFASTYPPPPPSHPIRRASGGGGGERGTYRMRYCCGRNVTAAIHVQINDSPRRGVVCVSRRVSSSIAAQRESQ